MLLMETDVAYDLSVMVFHVGSRVFGEEEFHAANRTYYLSGKMEWD